MHPTNSHAIHTTLRIVRVCLESDLEREREKERKGGGEVTTQRRFFSFKKKKRARNNNAHAFFAFKETEDKRQKRQKG
jgi:hypothetical protein